MEKMNVELSKAADQKVKELKKKYREEMKENFSEKSLDEKVEELSHNIEEAFEKIDETIIDLSDVSRTEYIDMENIKKTIKKVREDVGDLDSSLLRLEEKVDIIIKVLKIEEKVEKLQNEKDSERFCRRICLLTSGKTFTVEEFNK